MKFLKSLCVILVILKRASNTVHEEETDPNFWYQLADDELNVALNLEKNVGVAKNVILFLGDGMGISTVTAARILNGQMQGKTGEETRLSFDLFPHVGLSKTYSVDHTTVDSASSGTAFLCGVKANQKTLGVSGKTKLQDCPSVKGNEVTSILRWSLQKGKAAGVVTTTRITHATPAASYCHSAFRDWEGDADMVNVTGGCKDIARQLIEDNGDINVIMGGGRKYFTSRDDSDPEMGRNDAQKEKGRRDGRNLINAWINDKKNKKVSHKYVWNATEFHDVDPMETDYLLGLFNQDHMEYELDRQNDKAGEPSLEEMTAKAIRILRRMPNGFFLLVEGGRIDHGHHEGVASRALHDTVMFAKAVGMATELTRESDTLIVVTADHSHTFVIAGYPTRGNPILGLEDVNVGEDNMPYTTLLYGNGPGYVRDNTTGNRPNITKVDTQANNYTQQSAVPLRSETHGGEDVAIFARGPMSHLFHGVHQENYIADVMAYASCVGRHSEDSKCAKSLLPPPIQRQPPSVGDSGGSPVRRGTIKTITICVLAILLLIVEP